MAESDDLHGGLSVAELRKLLEDHFKDSRSPDEPRFAHKWRFSQRGGEGRRGAEQEWCHNVMGSMLEDMGFHVLPSLSPLPTPASSRQSSQVSFRLIPHPQAPPHSAFTAVWRRRRRRWRC